MSETDITDPQKLLAAKQKLRDQTRELRGVEGCGTDGTNLRIYVSDATVKPRIPAQVDGFRVLVVPSGQFRAQASVRWTPKVGQRGSLTQTQENDPHVKETTSAQSRSESPGRS